ncbi:S24/S26 family peptidase [Cerasicoccus frondis]|uniref:S24/S26 family peptidase n=1 Tax=Cerasicoccus frondis TaxID=490090 RepID=UPI002852C588|nr:S24/S26 family peptidase [Cerasicoccus frondis]
MHHAWITVVATLIYLIICTGCATEETAPPPIPESPLSFRSSSHAARIVERQQEGRVSAPAEGASMQPLYANNTYLVITPIAYSELQPGMLIAYRNLSGRRVVHRLVEMEDGYWTAQGINNEFEDADYVTPHNLIGVVYGSFVADR